MFIMSALRKQPVWEAENGTGTATTSTQPPTSTNEGNDTAAGGADTVEGGNDTVNGASDDNFLVDDPKKETPEESQEGEFNSEPVTIDALKEMFDASESWNDAQLEPFVDLINNSQSRADLAKGLLEMHNEVQESAVQEITEAYNNTLREWRDEASKHPELGGENFDRTLATVKTAVKTYSENPDKVFEVLKLTGAGNSIHMIQLLHKMAASVPGEASPVEGAPASTGKNLADRLFGSPNPN